MAKRSLSQEQLSLLDGKVCSVCKQWQPFSGFHKKPDYADGRHVKCHDCSGNKEACRRNRQKNLEQRHVYDREYSRLHPERKVKHREIDRRYYQANKHKIIAKVALWSEARKAADPEGWRQHRGAIQKASGERHPETKRVANHNRRARVRRAVGICTGSQWKAICNHYGPRCLSCGKEAPLTLDHVIPLVRGGANGPANIQPLCWPCNRRKWQDSHDYRPDKGAWAQSLKQE